MFRLVRIIAVTVVVLISYGCDKDEGVQDSGATDSDSSSDTSSDLLDGGLEGITCVEFGFYLQQRIMYFPGFDWK